MLLVLLALILAAVVPSNAEQGYIPTPGGSRLFYQRVGAGSQTIVIPLGFLVYKDFQYLADRDRTVIFYDPRNRGRSDSISNPNLIGIQHDVEDLETIRKHFQVERFTAVGYSYFGKVVVIYALQYPGRLERIIQLGPVPIKLGTQYPPEFQNEDEKDVVNQEEVEKLRKLQNEGFHKEHPKEYCEMEWRLTRLGLVGNPANADKIEQGICKFPNEWPVNLTKHFEALLPTDQKLNLSIKEIANLQIPVLTIHGTKDRNAPYGSGREWASILPNARLLTVPGAAHQSWADAPDLVLPAINEFLNGHWPEKAEKISG